MRKKDHRRVPVGLRGPQEIFRVSATAGHEADVEAWLADVRDDLREIARYWIAQMRAGGDDVVMRIHDGCPVACLGDAPFGYVNAFAAHVNVGFFNGAALADPRGMLVGSGKRMRHVTIRPRTDADTGALRLLVRAAQADLRARLDAEQTVQDGTRRAR